MLKCQRCLMKDKSSAKCCLAGLSQHCSNRYMWYWETSSKLWEQLMGNSILVDKWKGWNMGVVFIMIRCFSLHKSLIRVDFLPPYTSVGSRFGGELALQGWKKWWYSKRNIAVTQTSLGAMLYWYNLIWWWLLFCWFLCFCNKSLITLWCCFVYLVFSNYSPLYWSPLGNLVAGLLCVRPFIFPDPYLSICW